MNVDELRIWLAPVLMLCATVAAAHFAWRRKTKKKILALPGAVEGFGKRTDRVVITFADGTTRESTWGEIEAKVKEINGVSWWVEERNNIVLTVGCTVLGLAGTFLVYYLQLG